MTGFASRLVGRLPPFPYWPPDRIAENSRLLQQELQGRSPAGGIEVKVMRKDGSVFDARMYVSPLIDPRGQQTGWMTSMTNITEAKRIRDQLSASHERFTTVLEGLDAAVSVLSVQQGELLFANRSYRLWFGGDARGHALLAGGVPDAPFVPEGDDAVDNLSGLPTQALTEVRRRPARGLGRALQKWFDVRARYLQWTDGRLAQMLIATDITARLRAEEQAAAPGREGAGDEPPGDDGRDGVVGGARAQPAADGDHQLLQRHDLARARRLDRRGRSDGRARARPRARPSAPARSSTASAPS
jgi:PAS domain S-box-containing protein